MATRALEKSFLTHDNNKMKATLLKFAMMESLDKDVCVVKISSNFSELRKEIYEEHKKIFLFSTSRM